MNKIKSFVLLLVLSTATACAPVVYDGTYRDYRRPSSHVLIQSSHVSPAYDYRRAYHHNYHPIEVTLYADHTYVGFHFEPIHLVFHDGDYIEIPLKNRRGHHSRVYAHYHHGDLHFDRDRYCNRLHGATAYRYDKRWDKGRSYSHISAGPDYDLRGMSLKIRKASNSHKPDRYNKHRDVNRSKYDDTSRSKRVVVKDVVKIKTEKRNAVKSQEIKRLKKEKRSVVIDNQIVARKKNDASAHQRKDSINSQRVEKTEVAERVKKLKKRSESDSRDVQSQKINRLVKLRDDKVANDKDKKLRKLEKKNSKETAKALKIKKRQEDKEKPDGLEEFAINDQQQSKNNMTQRPRRNK